MDIICNTSIFGETVIELNVTSWKIHILRSIMNRVLHNLVWCISYHMRDRDVSNLIHAKLQMHSA